jgi:hypothetical protein
MVGIVHGHLPKVIQLPCLAGLYGYARIRVGGGMVGVVAQEPGAYQVAVFIYLLGVGIAWLTMIGFCLPSMMLIYLLFLFCGNGAFRFVFMVYLFFAAFVEFIGISLGIVCDFLFNKGAQAGIGFDEGTVNCLPLATHHSFVNTEAKDLFEQGDKYFFSIELACSADGAEPWQFSSIS